MISGSGENVYRALGAKIDNLPTRAPWNETFHSILKELYTPEEADLVVKLPYTLSSLDRIARITKIEKARLRTMLEQLCKKGLVMDIWNEKDKQYHYMPSPLVIGIFEFTMMRTGDGLNTKQWAKLFHEYMSEEGSFYTANLSHGEKVSVMRVIPVEETIRTDEHIEFLDYEKATSLIESADRFALALCSCRNEKFHEGKKVCDTPLDNCSLFGIGADMAIRNNLAREVSKSEMMENFARSLELGLVFCMNNAHKPLNVCHCCKCCCNALAGLSRFGYPNAVISSRFISTIHGDTCTGCGKCVDVCPVNATSLTSANDPKKPKRKKGQVNAELCLGCGVCAYKCPTHSIEMISRGNRVIQPGTLFETTILGSLERGTLQNQIFDNPMSGTQGFMRSFMGAFLRLPMVKRALMSDALRSSFLQFMKIGARAQGKGWITEL